MARLEKQDVPFTQVANEVLNDERISLKAKGVFAYLFSKPSGWDFAAARIATDSVDGERSVNAALRELEENGYLDRRKKGDGKVDYFLKFDADPKRQNSIQGVGPKMLKQQTAETAPISNKEKKVTRNTIGADEFFENSDLHTKAVDWLENKGMSRNLAEREIKKFIDYWTEPSKNGKKVRWEAQKFFDPRRRLVTWFGNAQKFSSQPPIKNKIGIAI